MTDTHHPILLYDGDCGFCARSVRFILNRDHRRKTIRFAPLQGDTARRIRQRHPELNNIDSVVFVQPNTDADTETIHTRSAATIATLRYIGGPWSALATLISIIPRPLRDAAYDVIARHRARIAGSACQLPTPEQSERFLP